MVFASHIVIIKPLPVIFLSIPIGPINILRNLVLSVYLFSLLSIPSVFYTIPNYLYLQKPPVEFTHSNPQQSLASKIYHNILYRQNYDLTLTFFLHLLHNPF